MVGSVENCFILNVVDSCIDFNELRECNREVVDDIFLMVGEEIGNEGMFGRDVGVQFGEEDFCHVRQRFGVDFNGFALFVGFVEDFTFEDLCAHANANLFGYRSRLIGESFECRALLNPQSWLQRDHDAA